RDLRRGRRPRQRVQTPRPFDIGDDRRHQGGDHADHGDDRGVHDNRPEGAAGRRHQSRADQWRETAAEGVGDLVTDVHAGRTRLRVEHLGEHRRERGLHRDSEDDEAQDLPEPDQPHVARAEHHEGGVDHRRESEAADDVDGAAPDPIGDRAPQWSHHDLQEADHHGSGESHPGRQLLVGDHERQAVGEHDVTGDRLRETDEDAHDRVLRVPERLDQRVDLLADQAELQCLRLGEGVRFLELSPQQHGGDGEDDREHERNAPAPLQEPRVVRGTQCRHQPSGEDVGDPGAADEEGAIEPAPAGGCRLDHHGRCSPHLSADEEALQEPAQQKQERCRDPDRLIGRDEPDSGRGDAHADHRAHEHDLAPDPVADDPPDDAAERTEEEPDGERRERRQLRDDRVVRGEEHGREDRRRGQAVQVVVVVLDDGADRATGDRLALLRCEPAPRRRDHPSLLAR
ncbi:unnamed protein product, partial [Penicillium discolor]